MAFTTEFIKELLSVPKEMEIRTITFDPASDTVTLIGFSEEPIEGFTYSFKESDTKEDRLYQSVTEVIRRKQHEVLETE